MNLTGILRFVVTITILGCKKWSKVVSIQCSEGGSAAIKVKK
jgi:hypothetical protein